MAKNIEKTPYKVILIATLFISTAVCYATSNLSWRVVSPNKKIMIEVMLEDLNHQLIYKVERFAEKKSYHILETSPLGLIRDDQPFYSNLTFVSKSEETVKEDYSLKIGRQSHYVSNANAMTLNFTNEFGSKMGLEVRAYDSGVAYRYIFPENSSQQHTIIKELSGFKLPTNGKAWIQSYDKPTQYSPAYERFYETGIPIGKSSPLDEGWAFPALFQANKSWILISEANLTPTYCGTHLNADAKNGLYTIKFPEKEEAQGIGQVEPRISLPWSSPWRFITVTTTAGQMIETNMVYDLSDKPETKDYSWVKPGRASWSWLSDNMSPKNFEKLKEYVDFSASIKWEYCLVDANWDLMEGGTIEELAKYAKTKGVGILMWYNSGGPNNAVTERPRDIIYDSQKRRAEFAKLEQWGVKGIKIDFWGSDKQDLIKLYDNVLKDAAEYHILVNLHGCTLPRGWSKTYPHLISYEAVKGEENYLFDPNYPENAAIQNTVLAFTRNVVGPMDYTPVVFSNFRYPHLTTNAHELALSIVFNSGIIHFADSQKVYARQPDFVRHFLSSIPAVFDESHCLWGDPQKGIVIACRLGNDWFVAGINSLNKKVVAKFDLSFLKKSTYQCELITDSQNLTGFSFSKTETSERANKKITMQKRGGFVMRLIRK